MPAMVEVDDLVKHYGEGPGRITALAGVSFSIERATITAIVGPSGSGKSTLARCINSLVRPTSGRISIDGADLATHTVENRRRIGTIFQGSSLQRRRTALRNVLLPLEFAGVDRSQARARAQELLDLVGLGGRGGSYPAELSGGQKQRVGIARALALRPSVLLADEATTGLDHANRASVLQLLRDLRAELGLTIILITHEMDVAREIADNALLLAEGSIVERGAIRDLVLQDSLVRDNLFPPRPHLAAPDRHTYRIHYAAREVPLDWVARLSERLPEPLQVLGATVEELKGEAVGYMIVASTAGPAEITRAGGGFGLQIRELGSADE
ncbi:MAG: methionine ABC transporter ATP-binding protein [Propionicimonas sp.]|nr:methionine ABC transporter ATP-binding protein [Propionicimonas sp.]